MRNGDPGSMSARRPGSDPAAVGAAERPSPTSTAGGPPAVIVTEISPFHCLYQDALDFHTQSRVMLPRSMGSASRLARAALLLYVASSEALVHQAAAELVRPDLARTLADPARPLTLAEVWQLLPAIVADATTPADADGPPWPQFAELLALRSCWAYPGPASSRRAYYRANATGSDFEPLQTHLVPAGLAVPVESLPFPRTGLPRDPYALRPHHLDTARGVLDSAIEALDRRLDGALTRDNRHRREMTRPVHPAR